MGQLGRIPKAGDMVELKAAGARMQVEEMDKLRVARIRLTRIPPQNGEGSPSSAQAEE
jgi:CBS domain containing-hemolysin-like protein